MAVMAPGPAISGMARGNVAVTPEGGPACSRSRSARCWNTISKAMANSSKPPAMRKAASEMPSRLKSQSPIRALPASTQKAIRLASRATLRRVASSSPLVRPIKTGPMPIGSITTSRVTKAEINCSGMSGFRRAIFRASSAYFSAPGAFVPQKAASVATQLHQPNADVSI